MLHIQSFRSTSSRRARALAAGMAAVVLGALAIAVPAGADAAPILMSRVKCVNISTGLAHYSPSGLCGRGERIDRRPCATGGSCVIGDVGPGRGKVFYVAPRVQPWGRYLEAAPASWNPNGDPNLDWCQDVTTSVPGTSGTALGTGKANTAAIAAFCTSGAANSATAYRGGGKSDWYLPAIDELRQLFLHKAKVGTFQLHGYWSSSQSDPNMAWMQDFYADNTPATSDKSFASYVRPIRAFR